MLKFEGKTVYLSCGATDMRKSINGLSAIVEGSFGLDPFGKAGLEALVKYYEEQLRLAKHRQFGSSSEKGEAPEQLGLFDEVENTADSKQTEPKIEEITYSRRKRVGKREEDLSGLPVEVVEYDLPESERLCPDCSGALHEMAHNVRRELKIIPAQVKVVEHKQTVYACRHCEKNSDHTPIVEAPTPEPAIKGNVQFNTPAKRGADCAL